MDEKLHEMLKYLRLGGLSSNWDEYMSMAREKNYSHVRLLRYMLEEECKIKKKHALDLRLKRARIPEMLAMETYPFRRQPKLNRKMVMSLYDGFDYMTKSQNIIWIGPTGCGKTGMATSFVVQAIHRGYSGRYVLFPELLNQLYASMADHTEDKVIKKYLSYDCLAIDEVGYVEVEPAQVGQFFTLLHKRHRTKPTFITSNLGFKEWGTFFKNDHLTAALIDRLTENSHVINMKNCVSLRAKLCADA